MFNPFQPPQKRKQFQIMMHRLRCENGVDGAVDVVVESENVPPSVAW